MCYFIYWITTANSQLPTGTLKRNNTFFFFKKKEKSTAASQISFLMPTQLCWFIPHRISVPFSRNNTEPVVFFLLLHCSLLNRGIMLSSYISYIATKRGVRLYFSGVFVICELTIHEFRFLLCRPILPPTPPQKKHYKLEYQITAPSWRAASFTALSFL